MKCPHKLCDAEIDPATFTFDAKIGRRGKCPKCHRAINISRQPSRRKRMTNSQRRKYMRDRLIRETKS